MYSLLSFQVLRQLRIRYLDPSQSTVHTLKAEHLTWPSLEALAGQARTSARTASDQATKAGLATIQSIVVGVYGSLHCDDFSPV